MKSLILSIAGLFSDKGITWAIGGSVTLKRRGIDIGQKDIDIITTLDDFDEAEAILSSIGRKLTHETHPVFKSKKYAKFSIGGYEVDLISCFQIVTGKNLYTYLFSKDSISIRDTFSEGTVNYTSLEDWYVLYLLMDRSQDAIKIEALESYFHTNGIERRDLLEGMLEQAPKGITEYVRSKFPR